MSSSQQISNTGDTHCVKIIKMEKIVKMAQYMLDAVTTHPCLLMKHYLEAVGAEKGLSLYCTWSAFVTSS